MLSIENVFTYTFSAASQTDLFQTFTGDTTGANVINLNAANIKLGAGKPTWLVAQVGAAFDALTSLEILLETDTAEAFNTNVLQVQTWNIALGDMDAIGDILINQPLPHFQYQQYLRMKFNVVGSDNTVGSIFAALSDAPLSPPLQLDMVNL